MSDIPFGNVDGVGAIDVPLQEAMEIRDEWKDRALKAEAEVKRLREAIAAFVDSQEPLFDIADEEGDG